MSSRAASAQVTPRGFYSTGALDYLGTPSQNGSNNVPPPLRNLTEYQFNGKICILLPEKGAANVRKRDESRRKALVGNLRRRCAQGFSRSRRWLRQSEPQGENRGASRDPYLQGKGDHHDALWLRRWNHLHARGRGEAVQGHPRTSPSDRGQGSPQAPGDAGVAIARHRRGLEWDANALLCLASRFYFIAKNGSQNVPSSLLINFVI